jgi:predicted metal-dependent phosphotriesterase family hydrolase
VARTLEPVTFIRTVLGDIEPEDLGPTHAHEHLVIDGGRVVELNPDFLLDDVDKAVAELEPARALGLAAIVDATPCGFGRNPLKLAEASRRSGVHVVAATGLHLAEWYDPDGWTEHETVAQLAARFVADIAEGIDAHDYRNDVIERVDHRAGVIKIAGSPELTDRERRVYEAAAIAHERTGCPVLTHCTDGLGAIEQVALLAELGVRPRHVTLSHTDKVIDRGYHREILATGASVEYDQGFRWKPDVENGTLTLLAWMIEDGFDDEVMLGMDAARQGYWTTYGGKPGWTFLLGEFAEAMRTRGITADLQRTIFVSNPARAFAFAEQL